MQQISYPSFDDPYLVKIKKAVSIETNGLNYLSTIKRIAGVAHNLFSHDGSNMPKKGQDALSIIKEARGHKKFRCVEYSVVARALFYAHKIPARVVGLKIKEVEIKKKNAGHVVAEVWVRELSKWIVIDIQAGVLFHDNKKQYLSAVELKDFFEKEKLIEIDLVENNKIKFGNKDKEKYMKWLEPYLFYIDTPLCQDTFLPTEENPMTLMFLSSNAKPPKVFQGIKPINVVTTTEAGFFNKSPL